MMSGYDNLLRSSIDGTDYSESHNAVKEAIKYIKSGKGPVLIEAHVVRLLSHSSSDDQKKYRDKKELEEDATNCPILKLSNKVIGEGIITEDEFKQMEEDVKKEEPKIVTSKGEIEKSRIGEFDDHQPPITRGSAPAAPSVRLLARELGVDIQKIPGTGPAGRISLVDVKAYVKSLNEKRTAAVVTGILQKKLPDFTKYGKVENVPMSKIRKVAATHLSYAWSTIPHRKQFETSEITALEKERKSFNQKADEDGGKLTITSILIKVLTEALKKFHTFNCSIDIEKQEIIYKKYYNIGIAVDTENGLMVPVIKNTDTKNLTKLSVEMGQLAKKARERKISLEELQGGSITITNLGGIGGTSFTPIINSPEVAILGVSRGSQESIYKNGKFSPRLMLPLSLSYDHRIIDGADAARFLRWVCEALEDPKTILTESN